MAQQANLLQGPEPCETADLHFKQYCKLKIFESGIKHEGGNCNLVAVSQYYGLIFVGTPNGFSVLKSKLITNNVDFEEYPRKNIVLNSKPTHLCVDFGQKILAVVCNSKTELILTLYSIASFSSKDALPTLKVLTMKSLSKLIPSLAMEVLDIAWQPNLDGSLVVCMSDGSVLSLSQNSKDGSQGYSAVSLNNTTQATCICWSPKGKQIVIGNASGTLSQYKPDLKLVKTLPAPPLFDGNVIVISVLWLSSFQFAAAYNDRNNPELFPVITIVNAAKNEPVNVINYDDITYSSTLFRNHQMYMFHQSAWNLIFISSANSIEVAVLHSKDNLTWEQWLLGDASRAELPLDANRQETFPLGTAFDYTSQDVIQWGEGSLPPMPRLLILSDEGVLSIFDVVNAAQNAPQLCGPPQEVVSDSLFTCKPVAPAVSEQSNMVQTSQDSSAVLQKTIQTTQTFTGQPQVTFGSSKPAFNFGSNTSFGAFAATSAQSQPQVTITIQGGAVLSGPKDLPLIAQPPQLTMQQLQQSQPVIISTQNATPTTTLQFSSSAPQFGAPAFSFGSSNTASLFSAKAAASQGTTTLSKSSSQVPVFKEKPAAQGDIFAGKTNILQSTPIKQVEAPEKPVTKTETAPAKTEDVVESLEKSEVKSPSGSPGRTTPELAAVDDSVYLNALQEEIDHFNSELKHLSSKVNSLNIQIGTDEDKVIMQKTLDKLYDFWKELKETTVSQTNEIHSVVTDVMESFAWLEDAKSRNLQRKNPSFIEIKKSQELDPISARHMREIAHLTYYIENQLKQLTTYLEKEWVEHQDNYRMEVKNQMSVPPLEEVYKTMHFQLKILNKQRILLEELKEKVAAKKHRNKSHVALITDSSPLLSDTEDIKRSSELSKLAENLLQLKISREDLTKTGSWEIMKSQLKSVCERSKKLTSEKQAALREVLSERSMVVIRPQKSTFESSSFIRSTPLEKSVLKSSRSKLEKLQEKTEKIYTSSPIKSENMDGAKQKQDVEISKVKPEKSETLEKSTVKKQDTPKSVFVFGSEQSADKPLIPATVQPPVSKTEDKCPLASLSGIVFSIGKENEAKPQPATNLSYVKPQIQTTSKDSFQFGYASVKPQTKPEETKMSQSFSFGASKPAEPVFTIKTDPPKFGAKATFGVPNLSATVVSSTKPEITKNTSASAFVCSTPVTIASPSLKFTFTTAATTSSTTLPTTNFFSTKDVPSGFGSATTTVNFFSVARSTPQSSNFSFMGNSTPIFGGTSIKPSSNTFETPTSTFGMPKTTSEALPKTSSVFSFFLPPEMKTTAVTTEAIVTTSTKPIFSTEEIKSEDAKKTESSSEAKKDSSKVSPPPSKVFSVPLTIVKPVTESNTVTSPSIQIVPAIQNTMATATTAIFTKPVVATSSETTSVPAVVNQSAITSSETAPTESTLSTSTTAAAVITSTTTTVTTTSTVFMFPLTTSSTLVFGQAAITSTTKTTTPATTTTATNNGVFVQSPKAVTTITAEQVSSTTTTTNIFGQSPKTTATTNIFEVSSTTPTTNIFGGATTTAVSTTNIFGSTTPNSKPIFGQASVTTTPTSGNIFGNSAPTTPTTNIFGQVSNPTSTPSVFGQKTDTVAETANVFGQLLSDSNRSGNVFGTPATTPTTTAGNLFSNSKNIFGGASTTTTSIFGNTSSSTFPQTTSVFGQPTTSSSLFGQSQTPTSNTFFGQNICSSFIGTNSGSFAQSNFGKPLFGESLFGQTTSNTSIFGGSSRPSIFGGSSTSATSGGSVFQTPTTSGFGTGSSGLFSSGQGNVSKTGFGTAATFQKPVAAGGFGSPPVFGGGPGPAPTFGAPPTFGTSSNFGSLPSFQSRPFDSSQGGFSPLQGHSTTFENLANQNTLGFGNLAQQSPSQGFGGAGFGTPSFENKPGFGEKFSSWRSS